jgi:hypothetical protein
MTMKTISLFPLPVQCLTATLSPVALGKIVASLTPLAHLHPLHPPLAHLHPLHPLHPLLAIFETHAPSAIVRTPIQVFPAMVVNVCIFPTATSKANRAHSITPATLASTRCSFSSVSYIPFVPFRYSSLYHQFLSLEIFYYYKKEKQDKENTHTHTFFFIYFIGSCLQ